MTFDSDLAVVSSEVPMSVPIPMLPGDQHTDDSYHSVVSFLGRAQRLSSFKWETTSKRSANLFKPAGREDGLLIPTGMFANRKMVSAKLDGFTSFKATAVLKLQINSQPFQAGRLLMAAAPVPALLGNRGKFIFSHVSNAQNINHVQMDISKDTEVELRIPFISPYNCFDLIDGKFDWAEVRILVYSPLQSVDTTCLECTVWGHFEDIQMGAPTSGQVLQQSKEPSSAMVNQARAKEATGKFTGALGQLGNNLVNKGLSLINPFTSVVDNAISAMGWSKPILAKPTQVFLQRPTEGFQYMDGVDQSLVLAMTAGNNVDSIPNLVGVGLDETNFHVLKRIPQMISAFTYSNKILSCKDASNEPVYLWSAAVSPSTYIPACYYLEPPSDPNNDHINPYKLKWKQPTTLNYITSPFLYWTGSLVYTFKFVKTDYHSGRVEISYHPFVNDVDPTRMDYVYRTVVDLRKNTEVSVTIPYIAAQPWKRISTYLDPVNPSPPDPGRLKDVIGGMIYVQALTPLICNSSICPQDIEVLVEMRAGDDFDVSGPVTSKYLPYSFQNPVQQSGRLVRNKKNLTLDLSKIQQDREKENEVLKFLKEMNFKISESMKNPRQQSGFVHIGQVEISSRFNIKDPPIYVPGEYITFLSANNEKKQWNWNGPSDTYYIEVYTSNPPDWGNSGTLSFGNSGTPNIAASPTQSVSFRGLVYIQANSTLSWDGTGNKGCGMYCYIFQASEETEPNHVVIDSAAGPLDVNVKNDSINVNQTQKPLDVNVTNENSGGNSGLFVTTPGWITEFGPVTTIGEPKASSANKDVKVIQQSGTDQFALAGVTETRTNAMEGWMPPSITQKEQDAHRISTTKWCSGEAFYSFRQYTRRFAFMLVNTLSTVTPFKIQPVELIRPGAIVLRGVADQLITDTTQYALYTNVSKSEVSGSPLSFVAGMYAFYRGSIRVKVWCDPRQNYPSVISGNLEYQRQKSDTNNIDDNMENFMTPIAYEVPKDKIFAEFQIPYYSPTIVSSTWSHANDNQFDTPLTALSLNIPETVVSAEGEVEDRKTPVKVGVAGGDDLDFHQFIGPPPVINIVDLTHTSRQLHYPPTGFTPTQKITIDASNPEKAASNFTPVDFSSLTVKDNPTGNTCGASSSDTFKVTKRSIIYKSRGMND